MIVDVSGLYAESQDKEKQPQSYTTEQGNMTTDVPVQFLKLPETEKPDNQAHNVLLIPIPTRKPKTTESQTITNKTVPVPTRKPLPKNATLEDILQRYIAEQSPYLHLKLAPLNNTNSYTTESSWIYPNNIKSPYYQHMGEPYNLQRLKIRKYLIGSLSQEFESNGNPAAIGFDTAGGHSYGLYQIATRPGTMKEYLEYLANHPNPAYKNFAKTLNNAGGNYGAINRTLDFENAWKKLARDPEFSSSQSEFIGKNRYDKIVDRIQDIQGLDLQNRHPVVKDAIRSMAVQHGQAQIPIHKALGTNSNISSWSDEEIINALYDARTEYIAGIKYTNPSDIKKQQNIIHKRYPKERKRALAALKIAY